MSSLTKLGCIERYLNGGLTILIVLLIVYWNYSGLVLCIVNPRFPFSGYSYVAPPAQHTVPSVGGQLLGDWHNSSMYIQ